ncbi:hypothetical protein PR048_025463 [Dryococelus australis]|uniref:Uncharacterized protein n=1 Tax=Dryococelus australis TaxID=614101 RepID=A0ABQ9GRG7_9NEOP|nr:hypothetical protein PR048_025463 [Dryococelus australis]
MQGRVEREYLDKPRNPVATSATFATSENLCYPAGNESWFAFVGGDDHNGLLSVEERGACLFVVWGLGGVPPEGFPPAGTMAQGRHQESQVMALSPCQTTLAALSTFQRGTMGHRKKLDFSASHSPTSSNLALFYLASCDVPDKQSWKKKDSFIATTPCLKLP